MLSACGIVLVFLPVLNGSDIQGATFIERNRIVICIADTARIATDMQQVLFQELAHVSLGHIYSSEGLGNKEEKAVDEWASRIPTVNKKFLSE